MPPFAMGVLCVVTALVVNEWTVARLLSLHGRLEPQALRISVRGFQLVAAVAGIMLVRQRSRLSRAWFLALPIPIVGLLAGAEATTRAVLNRYRLPLRTASAESLPGARVATMKMALLVIGLQTDWGSRF